LSTAWAHLHVAAELERKFNGGRDRYLQFQYHDTLL
jgi:hypothetical protein